MLSEDFAYAWEEKRPWEAFYQEEIVNNEMYKTLFFRYKDQKYQFQSAGYLRGQTINGKAIKLESYMFFHIAGDRDTWHEVGERLYFDSFKEAVDNARMDDGKSLKEIWDDPESEYLDFA